MKSKKYFRILQKKRKKLIINKYKTLSLPYN